MIPILQRSLSFRSRVLVCVNVWINRSRLSTLVPGCFSIGLGAARILMLKKRDDSSKRTSCEVSPKRMWQETNGWWQIWDFLTKRNNNRIKIMQITVKNQKMRKRKIQRQPQVLSRNDTLPTPYHSKISKRNSHRKTPKKSRHYLTRR